jgi:hypothetical protein
MASRKNLPIINIDELIPEAVAKADGIPGPEAQFFFSYPTL